jgi:hypothetical protein
MKNSTSGSMPTRFAPGGAKRPPLFKGRLTHTVSTEVHELTVQRGGGTVSISLPAKIGVECGLPSGDPPACSTVTA